MRRGLGCRNCSGSERNYDTSPPSEAALANVLFSLRENELLLDEAARSQALASWTMSFTSRTCFG